MSLRYTYGQFLFPPRPKSSSAIAPRNLSGYEAKGKGWWCDIKKNGSGSVISVGPERRDMNPDAKLREGSVVLGPNFEITVKRRDRSDHKLWTARPEVLQAFRRLPPHSVVAAELLHSKVKGMRDVFYIHDIMAIEGAQLVGQTFAERRKILLSYFPTTTLSIDGHYYVIDEHTWLSRPFQDGFEELFASLRRADGTPKRADDEGIVLKNPKIKLEPCFSEDSNSHWQRKCRIEHKNYQY